MTKLNQALLELIKNYDGHLTAEELLNLAKARGVKVSLASVYRVLTSFEEQGLIRRVGGIGDKDIYDRYTYSHGHLICKNCGKVSDLNIKELSTYLEEKSGVKIDSYDLSINYLCEECKKKLK